VRIAAAQDGSGIQNKDVIAGIPMAERSNDLRELVWTLFIVKGTGYLQQTRSQTFSETSAALYRGQKATRKS
jgi:hypothetical protein